MTLLENLLGDLTLVLMQHSLVRWSVALAASLWVWMIGDRDARLRLLYLLAPFAIAVFVEVSALFRSGPGGPLSQLLVVQEAARRIASPVGLGAIGLVAILGFMRGIGFAIGVALLLTAYFTDISRGREAGFGGALVQAMMLLPSVLTVLLTAYGIGASIRRFRERRVSYD